MAGKITKADVELLSCIAEYKFLLKDGVSQHQRVSRFRLAVHLKNLGIPYDIAEVVLIEGNHHGRISYSKGIE